MAIKYFNDVQIAGSITSANSADDTNKILLKTASGDISLHFVNGVPCISIGDDAHFIIPEVAHSEGGTLATLADTTNIESFDIPAGLTVSSKKVTWTQAVAKNYTFPPNVKIFSKDSSGAMTEVIADNKWNGTSVVVTLNLSVAPAAGAYKMVVIGK